MWQILRGDAEAVVHWAPFLTIGGFGIAGLSIAFDDHGIITGFFLAALGVSAAGLSEWRSERGLWMLATVYLPIYGCVYSLIILSNIIDALRGVPANGPALVVDSSLGTLLLVALLRFVLKVARENYYVSNRFHGDH